MPEVVRQVFFPVPVGAEQVAAEPTPESLALFRTRTEEASDGGWYPVGSNSFWHGGVHLGPPLDPSKDTCKDNDDVSFPSDPPIAAGTPVYACASGTVFAARIADVETSSGYIGSSNFVLTQHLRANPAGEGDPIPFFVVHMHVAASDEAGADTPPWVERLSSDDKATFEAGGLIKPSEVQLNAGELLWWVGPLGKKEKAGYGIHWEVFSADNAMQGVVEKDQAEVGEWKEVSEEEKESEKVKTGGLFSKKEEVSYTDDDCFMDCKAIEDLFPDGVMSDGKIDRKELETFYREDPDKDDVRRFICKFRSEWSFEWDSASMKAGLKAKKFRASAKKLKKRYDPYMWWSEVAPLESPMVWHYNPVEFLRRLSDEFQELKATIATQEPAFSLDKTAIAAGQTTTLSVEGLAGPLRSSPLSIEVRVGDVVADTLELTVSADENVVFPEPTGLTQPTDPGITLPAKPGELPEDVAAASPADYMVETLCFVLAVKDLDDVKKTVVLKTGLPDDIKNGVSTELAVTLHIKAGDTAVAGHGSEHPPVELTLDAWNVGYNAAVLETSVATAYLDQMYDDVYGEKCDDCWTSAAGKGHAAKPTSCSCPVNCGSCAEVSGACIAADSTCECAATAKCKKPAEWAEKAVAACTGDASCKCSSTQPCKVSSYYRPSYKGCLGKSCPCTATSTGGICKRSPGNGVPAPIKGSDGTIVWDVKSPTASVHPKGFNYCCGFTLWVAWKTASDEGLLEGVTNPQLTTFKQQWFGESDPHIYPQVANAVPNLNIGRQLKGHTPIKTTTKNGNGNYIWNSPDVSTCLDEGSPLERPLPGDFLQIWRSSSGHSVIFKDWVITGGKVTGIKYRSTQEHGTERGNGIGDNVESFSDCGGGVFRHRIFFARLTGPQT